jgi:hypothetical protein
MLPGRFSIARAWHLTQHNRMSTPPPFSQPGPPSYPPPIGTPLNYAYPDMTPGRPGLVIAMGVVSIIFSLFQIVTGLWSMLASVMGYLFVSHVVPLIGSVTNNATLANGFPMADQMMPFLVSSLMFGLLGLGLGLILLVAGIMVLTDRRTGFRLHGFWMWGQAIVAIVSTSSLAFITKSMMNQAGAGAGAPTHLAALSTASTLVSMLFQLSFLLAYPVALFFILRSVTVREHVRLLVR